MLIQADKIGSTKSYLMSIARTKDGITKKMNERMNIFVVYRNELGKTGDNFGYYYIDTNDWIKKDNHLFEAEIEKRQRLFTIKELNKKFSNDIDTNGVKSCGVKPGMVKIGVKSIEKLHQKNVPRLFLD